MIEYFEKLLKSITDSINGLDYEVFEELVIEALNTLKKGNKIVVSGLGKNVPICEKFVGTMLSMGLNAAFMHTNTAIHGDLGVVHEGDLVIILTKSGETAESVLLFHTLQPKKANLWLMTFKGDSALAKTIRKAVVIPLDHEGDQWDIVPNNSTTLNLIILQALAIRLSEELKITLEQFKVNHPGGYIGVQLNNEKR